MIPQDRGYFGTKSKGYDATMKRAVKKHSILNDDNIKKQED